MELKYKTRGDSNQMGKAKVYFSCHPIDFEAYFDIISGDILEREDCAIWYDDKQSEPENIAGFLNDLSQMQLFVIPITKSFLCEPNRAYDLEFSYAMEQKIPVLPIIQERGLDELFNDKCSEIQFLDYHDLDNQETARFLHEDRLAQYLSYVLIGNELTKEIRSAFDSHIFLSYRKQDKEYAHQLIQLIHNIDICRDVAIWYDEYLTSGENFNSAIEEAIKKCDLFIMAVTPNIVKEENYVMTTEYPLAVREKKPVLPIELVETSHAELRNKYKEIPACISAKDKKALEHVLAEQLQLFMPTERKEDPQHIFLIGLAYLSGIDMEVNKEKALALITSAAEAGLPEAMDQMANIYNMGDGTEINYETALKWRERQVIAEGKAYYSNPEKGYDEYFYALFQFATECQLHCGNLDMAEGIYLKMSEVVTSGHNISNKEDQILPAIYLGLGDIYLAKGALQSAYQYYDQARITLETVPTNDHSMYMDKQRDLQNIYYYLAFSGTKLNKYSEAREHLQKSLSIAELIISETGENDDKMMLPNIYKELGIICELEGNIPDAGQYYEKCISISHDIVAEKTTSEDGWMSLAIGYEKMANICTKVKNFTRADDYYSFSLAIYEALDIETTGNIYEKQGLGNICLTYGILLIEQGNLQEAEKHLTRGLRIHKELWEKSGLWQSHNVLALIYYKLGCMGDGNLFYLELACQLTKEQAFALADYGMELTATLSEAKKILAIRSNAKKRIRKLKWLDRKKRITSMFHKKHDRSRK